MNLCNQQASLDAVSENPTQIKDKAGAILPTSIGFVF